jgi:hypothetical protein
MNDNAYRDADAGLRAGGAIGAVRMTRAGFGSGAWGAACMALCLGTGLPVAALEGAATGSGAPMARHLSEDRRALPLVTPAPAPKAGNSLPASAFRNYGRRAAALAAGAVAPPPTPGE